MAQTKTSPETGDKSAPSGSGQRGGTTAPAESLEAARDARAKQMSVAGNKGDSKASAKEKTPAKPKFEPDTKLRDRLYGLTSEALLAEAGESLRVVDRANLDVYTETGNRIDQTNGQPVDRSAIRSEVLAFIASRPNKEASVAEIVAYMTLAQGKVFPGKFNAGYITTKSGGDAKRGMVGRGLLKMVRKGEPPKQEEAASA